MKGADKAGLETWERKNRPIKKDTCWSCRRALYFPLSVFLFVFVKKDGSEYHACHSERSRQAPPCQGGGTASILLLPVSNSLQTLTRAPQCHCPCLCIFSLFVSLLWNIANPFPSFQSISNSPQALTRAPCLCPSCILVYFFVHSSFVCTICICNLHQNNTPLPVPVPGTLSWEKLVAQLHILCTDLFDDYQHPENREI